MTSEFRLIPQRYHIAEHYERRIHRHVVLFDCGNQLRRHGILEVDVRSCLPPRNDIVDDTPNMLQTINAIGYSILRGIPAEVPGDDKATSVPFRDDRPTNFPRCPNI